MSNTRTVRQDQYMTVPKSGRLTLPSQTIKLLNVKPGDELLVEINTNQITIKREPNQNEN